MPFAMYINELPGLECQIFLSIVERFLAFWAEIFVLGMALRKHIALDQARKSQSSDLIATRTDHERIRDGGSPGPQHVFLHNRHLPFFSISEETIYQEGNSNGTH